MAQSSLMLKLRANALLMKRYRRVGAAAGLVWLAIIDRAEQSAEPGVLRRGRDYEDLPALCRSIAQSDPVEVAEVHAALARLTAAKLLVLEEELVALPAMARTSRKPNAVPGENT